MPIVDTRPRRSVHLLGGLIAALALTLPLAAQDSTLTAFVGARVLPITFISRQKMQTR